MTTVLSGRRKSVISRMRQLLKQYKKYSIGWRKATTGRCWIWQTIRQRNHWMHFWKQKNANGNSLIEPHNHRVKAAERAMQTCKKYLISGFCCADSEWPLQSWNTLTKQALITLNLCRTSRKHPSKSACHSFYWRWYGWNKHLMAQPGTRSIVYESPAGTAVSLVHFIPNVYLKLLQNYRLNTIFT